MSEPAYSLIYPTVEAMSRAATCLETCKGIPTEALEAGVVEEMVGALENLVERFNRCMQASGTDEEYRDAAVAVYRTILAKVRP